MYGDKNTNIESTFEKKGGILTFDQAQAQQMPQDQYGMPGKVGSGNQLDEAQIIQQDTYDPNMEAALNQYIPNEEQQLENMYEQANTQSTPSSKNRANQRFSLEQARFLNRIKNASKRMNDIYKMQSSKK